MRQSSWLSFGAGWRCPRIRIRPKVSVATAEECCKARKPLSDILKSEPNPYQGETLGELEKFGWELHCERVASVQFK
jgi:hypothetical protein